MADAEEVDELTKPKRNKLVILLVVMNLALVGGAAAWFFLSGGDPAEAQEADEEQEPEELDPTVFGPLIELAPIIANLNDAESGRFLKVTMYVEVAADATEEAEAEALRAEVDAKIVPIRSRLVVYFSSCTVEETLGAENKERIALEIVELINEVLGEEQVRRVFYTEFVVQ